MSNKVISTALSAVLALGFSYTNSLAANATKPVNTAADMPQMSTLPGTEKCYGVAKKGFNDCGTDTHGCGGESKMDGDKKEWIAVPEGLCNKIVGGSLEPK